MRGGRALLALALCAVAETRWNIGTTVGSVSLAVGKSESTETV